MCKRRWITPTPFSFALFFKTSVLEHRLVFQDFHALGRHELKVFGLHRDVLFNVIKRQTRLLTERVFQFHLSRQRALKGNAHFGKGLSLILGCGDDPGQTVIGVQILDVKISTEIVIAKQ